MSEIELYRDGRHANMLLEDRTAEGELQANHHLVVHGREGLIIDPGGHQNLKPIFNRLSTTIGSTQLRHIVLSHQDPDILSSISGWLMVTDAEAWISQLWLRFVHDFGVEEVVAHRLRAIPDEGLWLDLGGAPIALVPAHFLHSAGNFQVYDPTAKVLYSGDLGSSFDIDYREVEDFDAHAPHLDPFHKRYLASCAALHRWVKMARELDIEILAPQHGAVFRGRAMVERFFDYCEGLTCGIDHLNWLYRLPPRG